eukprot:1385015-Amorphochlora_amoeboformis.AAC.1
MKIKRQVEEKGEKKRVRIKDFSWLRRVEKESEKQCERERECEGDRERWREWGCEKERER